MLPCFPVPTSKHKMWVAAVLYWSKKKKVSLCTRWRSHVLAEVWLLYEVPAEIDARTVNQSGDSFPDWCVRWVFISFHHQKLRWLQPKLSVLIPSLDGCEVLNMTLLLLLHPYPSRINLSSSMTHMASDRWNVPQRRQFALFCLMAADASSVNPTLDVDAGGASSRAVISCIGTFRWVFTKSLVVMENVISFAFIDWMVWKCSHQKPHKSLINPHLSLSLRFDQSRLHFHILQAVECETVGVVLHDCYESCKQFHVRLLLLQRWFTTSSSAYQNTSSDLASN